MRSFLGNGRRVPPDGPPTPGWYPGSRAVHRPMLTSRLTDQALLADPRYIAEPMLDGWRAQVHVEGARTVAAYSRPGRELLDPAPGPPVALGRALAR